VLFVTLFALSSLFLSEISWIAKTGINSLVLAIVLGIIYSNTLRNRLPDRWVPGIKFSAKHVLRLAIILYGFRVTFQQIASVGLIGLILDLFVVISTLLLGYWVGVKVFKLDRHLALLISSGSAICGAAAVLALENVLESEAYKATVAVGTVVLFGTIAMFLYPAIQNSGLLGFTENEYGIFAGSSIHEVAQALVAGSSISDEGGNIAVIVKMTRVLLLVPVLILLSFIEGRFVSGAQKKKSKLSIPWFAVIFVFVIGLNSLDFLPLSVITSINKFDIFLLTMAMAAIGMETNINKMKRVGLKPLYFATFLFAWLIISSGLLIKLMHA
jgi:uncharacterized integral membrane protein (TIGR00698 family)